MSTRYITRKGAAEKLGVGISMVRKLEKQGQLKRSPVRNGPEVLYTELSVERVRQRREKNPPKPGRPKKQGLWEDKP